MIPNPLLSLLVALQPGPSPVETVRARGRGGAVGRPGSIEADPEGVGQPVGQSDHRRPDPGRDPVGVAMAGRGGATGHRPRAGAQCAGRHPAVVHVVTDAMVRHRRRRDRRAAGSRGADHLDPGGPGRGVPGHRSGLARGADQRRGRGDDPDPAALPHRRGCRDRRADRHGRNGWTCSSPSWPIRTTSRSMSPTARCSGRSSSTTAARPIGAWS